MAGICTGPGPCDTTPFGSGDNWVNKVGGLPLYIRAIAKALRRSGHSESSAIATAIATVKRWAAGGGGVTPETRARAAAAVAEWERKKTQAHSLTAAPAETVDLAFTEALHPRAPKGATGGGRFAPKNTTTSSAGTAGMQANVRDFQRRNGLPVTGVIDPRTAALIKQAAAAKTAGGGKKGSRKAKTAAHVAARKRLAAQRKALAAQRKALGQRVSTINSMSATARAALRVRNPVPPTGYVWGRNDTLRRVGRTRAQNAVAPTGI